MNKKHLVIFLIALPFVFHACSEKLTDEQIAAQKLTAEHRNYDYALEGKLAQFGGLPKHAENPNNPRTDEKVKLGHVLYFDTRLSKNNTISCNSCHNLASFGVDNLATSPGDAGDFGDRNSPTVLNAALHAMQFWDGRAKDVEEQAGMPILNPVEMAIPNEKFLLDRLASIEVYRKLFKSAFPDEANPINYKNIEKAIAVFERDLITSSRFDQYKDGDKSALSLEEKKGLLTFINIGCTNCHNGVALGGTTIQQFGAYDDYWKYTKSKTIDKGKGALTKDVLDNYYFKTPSLRNIAETGPYFHDGSVKTLEEAVDIMAKIQLRYNLTENEKSNLVAFLGSLTGHVPLMYQQAPEELSAR